MHTYTALNNREYAGADHCYADESGPLATVNMRLFVALELLKRKR